MKQRDLNAVLGILGILVLGIFLVWFPAVVLQVPMPHDVVANTVVNTMWATMATVVLPYLWAVKRLGMGLGELGLTTERLGRNILVGCGLYSIALVVFLSHPEMDMMTNNIVGQESLGRSIILMVCMGVTAAGTDLLTRGFVLLTLSKHSHVAFAIIMQNLVWYTGHLHEIDLLSSCLGTGYAILLTLGLGILGDVIVLRTRSVVGLATAHFFLNVILTFYIRQL